ncbi:IMP dehydrogenase [Candidatus Poribacteria bacterium]|jgi:IMP dehydrogenase|nr:IMP dehydrogenase [Candidatus Poribacteria bacterium]MBT5537092.1 IMP dehydrogenase [Candidatus Poribacteria bacterium]MBT5714632.1 IMP dehydrogenase [Candidatus Poribacteria bacterium]MBT7097675.1 IMP dehydrogenase [Candidatus Poribacteria bacterium]MBT7806152.1 IMP dehydrogenase [Candidatus Poribacteria bacterium]
MTRDKVGAVALTFDDVLLVPQKSHVHPTSVDTRTRITREIDLNIPIVSAAMDTVTDANLAIAVAREGGLGIIHRNCGIEDQIHMVDMVKRSESGMIVDPITLRPAQTVQEALALMEHYRIGGFPVIQEDGRLVGIVTNRDLRFLTDDDRPVSTVMTQKQLVTAPEGITLDEAKDLLQEHRIEKLPIVDETGQLRGLITIKDINKIIQYPDACKDSQGRLRVGAAVTAPAAMDEVDALVEANVDVLAVDTAHGHSLNVLEAVAKIRARHENVQIIAGNVATAAGTRDLINAGADAVKVGIGPGSICTTRVVAGVGVPQISAILECAEVANEADVPIIADGGVRYSGDIAKAIGAGASAVMIGSLFAGVDESPGETVIYQGRSFKVYRAMGSLSAMRERGGRERYQQGDVELRKLVPEGIEGRVPYKGKLHDLTFQLVGGLRSAMGYCGSGSITDLRENAQFVQITSAGVRESHPHDVVITEEAPNYSVLT